MQALLSDAGRKSDFLRLLEKKNYIYNVKSSELWEIYLNRSHFMRA